jgi:hypothetical protein
MHAPAPPAVRELSRENTKQHSKNYYGCRASDFTAE